MQDRRQEAHRPSYGGSCDLCGRNAAHSCRNCGRNVCVIHYKSESQLCTLCDSAREKKSMHEEKPLGQCAVCINNATKTCKSCGKSICDSHFNATMYVCIMCANRKHREEMKEGGGT